VAHGVHPARRPSGVLVLTRVRYFAALDELRGFWLKQKQKPKSKSKSKSKLKSGCNQNLNRGGDGGSVDAAHV